MQRSDQIAGGGGGWDEPGGWNTGLGAGAGGAGRGSGAPGRVGEGDPIEARFITVGTATVATGQPAATVELRLQPEWEKQ